MEFHDGSIDGVIWTPLKKYHDPRGWLCELFRHDELGAEFHPVMAYISATEPGIARGDSQEENFLPRGMNASAHDFRKELRQPRPAGKDKCRCGNRTSAGLDL